MTSYKGSNGGRSCNLKKKKKEGLVQQGALARRWRRRKKGKKKEGGKIGPALFFKSQRFFKFIE